MGHDSKRKSSESKHKQSGISSELPEELLPELKPQQSHPHKSRGSSEIDGDDSPFLTQTPKRLLGDVELFPETTSKSDAIPHSQETAVDENSPTFNPSMLCSKADINNGDLNYQIHVGNIPFHLSPEAIWKHLSQFGQIVRAHIPQKKDGRLVGFAMFEFSTPDEAKAAWECGTLDISGQAAHISPRKINKDEGASAPPPAESISTTEALAPSSETTSSAPPHSSALSSPPEPSPAPSSRLASRHGPPHEGPRHRPAPAGPGEAAATRKRPITATLYVGNLPYTQSGPSLQLFCDSYECDSVCVRVVTDQKTGKSRGFGYIDFETREAAEKAFKKLNGVLCQGRKLKLDWTESRRRDS